MLHQALCLQESQLGDFVHEEQLYIESLPRLLVQEDLSEDVVIVKAALLF